jgi:hypothetical protein
MPRARSGSARPKYTGDVTPVYARLERTLQPLRAQSHHHHRTGSVAVSPSSGKKALFFPLMFLVLWNEEL